MSSDKSIFREKVAESKKGNRTAEKQIQGLAMIPVVIGGLFIVASLALLLAFGANMGSGVVLLIGIALIICGGYILSSRKKRILKYQRYQAIVDKSLGRASIDNIAKFFPTDYATAARDLQHMIELGYFEGAYIDSDRRVLVLDRGNDIEDEVEVPVEEDEKDQTIIGEMMKKTEDEEIRGRLADIETVIKRINRKVESEPKLNDNPDVRKFMEFYLPKIKQLLEQYQGIRFDERTEGKDDIKTEIMDTLDSLEDASMSLWNKLIASDKLDISSELSALNTMLSVDGYTDEINEVKNDA